jgi:hypothetical protein
MDYEPRTGGQVFDAGGRPMVGQSEFVQIEHGRIYRGESLVLLRFLWEWRIDEHARQLIREPRRGQHA